MTNIGRTLAAAGLTVTTAICAAPLDRIDADLLDPKAPRGLVRTFDVTKMTVREMRTAAESLEPGQTIAVWCIGDRMGSDAANSAFDVFSGPDNAYGDRADEINRGLRKLGVTLDMAS